MDDNMASVREEARKRGGDELVAKVDAAHKSETELIKMLDERIEAAKQLPEGDERTLALVAITEALSATYARAAVAYGASNKQPDSQVMVLAIRSVVNSIQVAVEDRDAASSDIAGKIKQGFVAPKDGE